MTERLNNVMHEIIRKYQKGCISGRYIAKNIHLFKVILESEDDEYYFIV